MDLVLPHQQRPQSDQLHAHPDFPVEYFPGHRRPLHQKWPQVLFFHSIPPHKGFFLIFANALGYLLGVGFTF